MQDCYVMLVDSEGSLHNTDGKLDIYHSFFFIVALSIAKHLAQLSLQCSKALMKLLIFPNISVKRLH